MSGNPYCPACRGCPRPCFNCETMFAERQRHAEENRAVLAACPIAKGARVTRKGDKGEKWAGEVVARTVRRTKRGPVVVCRVRWENMRNGSLRWGGTTSIHSDIQVGSLEVLR